VTIVGLSARSGASDTENRRSRETLRFLAPPSETGVDGVIQAGHVLEWIDRAGFACAAAWSSAYCVTAYVGNIHFRRPVVAGDLVEADARIIHTGRSSMHIFVTISTADPKVGSYALATDCLLVFVAVDEQRRPRPIPTWRPQTVRDQSLADRAVQRINVRSRIREAMSAQTYSNEGTAPRMQFRFLAQPTHINWGGVTHGGTVMRWIDETAHSCVIGWIKKPALAVYAGGIHFDRAIRIGDIVEVDARIIHTSNRSIHVAARVSSADPVEGHHRRTTQCMSVFVSPGPDGQASPVRPIELRSDEDRRLDAHARDLITMRAELDALDGRG
jgi:4-hydroxybenzoyl-CoA thioesterase